MSILATRQYRLNYNRFKLLALNMFRWENLPPTLESRHIENALFSHGKSVFYDDSDLGLLCLPATYTGKFNAFGEGTTYLATGHGYAKKIHKSEGIIILNNDLGMSTEEYVSDYARKMAEVEISIVANIKQQKFPYFVETDKNTKRNLEIVFEKKDHGEPVIYGNKTLGIDNIKVLTLNTPYVADRLNSYKYELEREILTFFGLNNSYEKKERMLVDEVNSNNDFINRNVDIMFKNREHACKLINEKFGTNIKVVRINDDNSEGGEEEINE